LPEIAKHQPRFDFEVLLKRTLPPKLNRKRARIRPGASDAHEFLSERLPMCRLRLIRSPIQILNRKEPRRATSGFNKLPVYDQHAMTSNETIEIIFGLAVARLHHKKGKRHLLFHSFPETEFPTLPINLSLAAPRSLFGR
jgi:hypothetical protein